MKNFILRSTLFISIGLGSLTLFSYTDPGEKYFAIVKNLDIFATVYKEINTYYVDDVNPNELMQTGINAMLASLDPYTVYIPEDRIEDFRTQTTGEYGGIGAVVGLRNGKQTILMPYEGYPADKFGLRIGDIIEKVDGIDINDKSSDEINRLMKGQANTKVTLTITRFGVTEPLEITLVREHITVNNVPYYGMLSNNVGYVKLSDFTTNASGEVKEAVENLKKEGAKSLMLDLRDNPGGLLDEAIKISNLFIPKGEEVVSIKGKTSESNQTYYARQEPLDLDIPITVLVSSRSASASEIVAGVIQDYDRGVLIGDKTFGKGLVQTARPLSYNSQLKVTTAKYYIPSGRCIQAIDYGNRSEDGSAGKIADSLKVKFLTQSGRPVYDGGGIDPDRLVEPEPLAPISTALLANGLIFDFATEYQNRHESLPPVKEFVVNDKLYTDFIKWLEGKDYSYTTQVEEEINQLEEASKLEKSYSSIKPQLDALRQKFAHDKSRDLVEFKSEIMHLLRQEIAGRYYLQSGIMVASFDNDPDVKAALAILQDPAAYQKLLRK
jgi:carboxyl-terminal processing protease